MLEVETERSRKHTRPFPPLRLLAHGLHKVEPSLPFLLLLCVLLEFVEEKDVVEAVVRVDERDLSGVIQA